VCSSDLEGGTEEQVCEAIANTGEKDLWVRFGHLVPMYMPGSIFRMSCTFRGLTAGGGASPDQGKRAGGAVASTRVLKAHGAMGRVGGATRSTEHIVHARHDSTPRAARATADAGPRL